MEPFVTEPGASEPSLVTRFKETLRHEGWLPRYAKLVAGISGGSDSMALGALLYAAQAEFGWTVTVAHVHHGLRGDEADADAALVAAWAERWHFFFELLRVNIEPRTGRSLEMAAREERRAALMALAGSSGRVVLAHQLEDQAETVLLRFLRGTGVAGLAAMRPVSGQIVRPLLAYRRDELVGLLHTFGVPWREDASNQDVHILRNRVRHELMPLLTDTYNPRLTDALARLAASAQDMEDWAQAMARQWKAARVRDNPEAGEVRCQGLLQEPPALATRVLRLVAADLGFSVTEEQMRRALVGPTVWPKHHAVEPQGRDVVVARPFDAIQWPDEPLPLDRASDLPLPIGRLVVEAVHPGDDGPRVPSVHGLLVRPWRPGDRIFLGEGLRKKLQDVFVDAKIPKRLRHAWPVVVGGADEDQVLMLPGLATDPRIVAQRPVSGYWVRWER